MQRYSSLFFYDISGKIPVRARLLHEPFWGLSHDCLEGITGNSRRVVLIIPGEFFPTSDCKSSNCNPLTYF